MSEVRVYTVVDGDFLTDSSSALLESRSSIKCIHTENKVLALDINWI